MREIRMDGNNFLSSRTKDGLAISITLSFQYQLKITLDNVVELYYKWGDTGYEAAFSRMARSVLRDSVAEYLAIDMFKNRTSVVDKMRAKLSQVLTGLQASLQNFQLFEIKLPDKFSQTIENIEKYKQDLTSAEFKLQEAEQYATGMVDKAMQETAMITQEANGYAKLLSEAATARVEIDETNALNDKNAIGKLKTELGYSSDKDVLTHYFYYMVNATKLGVIGLSQPTANMLQIA